MQVGRILEAPAIAPTIDDLFRAHVDDVQRIVWRLLGPSTPEADVDDVTQLVFVAMHRALPRFRGDSAITTWIYGITTRVVLRHLRGRRRYRAMIERFESARVFDAAPPGVEETVAQRRALQRVWSALIRMKPEARVVLVLFDIEGLSAAEIAEALDLGEEAVRSRLRRARADLARRIDRMEGRAP